MIKKFLAAAAASTLLITPAVAQAAPYLTKSTAYSKANSFAGRVCDGEDSCVDSGVTDLNRTGRSSFDAEVYYDLGDLDCTADLTLRRTASGYVRVHFVDDSTDCE